MLPRLSRRRLASRHEWLVAPGFAALFAAFLLPAQAAGAAVAWGAYAAGAGLFLALALAAGRAGRREWLLALPLLGVLPPFVATPAPLLIWACYALAAVAMTVFVRPSLLYGAFLGLLPMLVWFTAFLIGYTPGFLPGAMLVAAFLAFSAFSFLGAAVHAESQRHEDDEAYARLVQMRAREPIDAELRESLGASIMAVAAECRLALAGDAAAMREHMKAADMVARWGLERLRVTSRALRHEPVECDAVAGFLRNAIRGLLGERAELSMQSELTHHTLPPEIAYGMAALVFDMLEAARAQEGAVMVGIFCDDDGFAVQLRRPQPEFAYAQTREWTMVRKRAARLHAGFTAERDGGRLTMRVAGKWAANGQ